jgi:hypothetical protein
MFIGIPVVLAIILVLAPTPKSATGSILRGMTLALLIVAPLVGECYLCILFASPLFLVVGLVIGKLVDYSRANRSTTLSCIAILFLPRSLEGIVPQLTHNRAQSVEAAQVVNASAAQVEAALAQAVADKDGAGFYTFRCAGINGEHRLVAELKRLRFALAQQIERAVSFVNLHHMEIHRLAITIDAGRL